MAIGDITSSLQSGLAKGATTLGDVLEKSAKDTQQVGKEFVGEVKSLGQIFKEFDSAVTESKPYDALKKGAEANMGAIKDASDGFFEGFSNFGDAWKSESMSTLRKIRKTNESTATSYGSIFGASSEAIKDLTGGLIDIQDLVDDGMKMAKGAMTLVKAPFQVANTAIAKTTKFFTGKEVNLGQKMSDWWNGTEEEVDGEVKKSKGMKGKLGDIMDKFRASFIGFAKTAGKAVGGVLKKGALMLWKGLLMVERQLLMIGARMLAAVVPLIVAGVMFVAGLIASAVAFMISAAPIIGIAALITLAVAAFVMAIMWVVKNFDDIKTFITDKITAMKDKLWGVVDNIVSTFTNIFQSISDGIRGKILSLKSTFVDLSAEEQAELDAINARKKAKEDAKKRKKAIEDETKKRALAELAWMEKEGQLEGMSKREKLAKLTELAKKHKETVEAEFAAEDEKAAYEAQTTEELLNERKAAAELEKEKLAEEKEWAEQGREVERQRNAIDAQVRKEAENWQVSSTITEDGVTRDNSEEEKERLIQKEIQRRQDMREVNDEELRLINEAETEAGNEAFIAKQRQIRAQEHLDKRDDYVEARVLTEAEKEQIGADTMGMSLEEYRAAAARDDQKSEDFLDGGDEYTAELDYKAIRAAQDRAAGDRIKDAGDAVKTEQAEAAQMGPPAPSPSNVNTVQQNNVSNTVTRTSDPAPFNPEPSARIMGVNVSQGA